MHCLHNSLIYGEGDAQKTSPVVDLNASAITGDDYKFNKLYFDDIQEQHIIVVNSCVSHS